ncbi:hypothetical protein WI25_36715 [Burkholderia cepacia]|nr:hypothetical protein WI27_27160 [Burkholderia cepacia]KUY83140.1 hypothetical protein WI25_36715 [Burkholderia cepacia]
MSTITQFAPPLQHTLLIGVRYTECAKHSLSLIGKDPVRRRLSNSRVQVKKVNVNLDRKRNDQTLNFRRDQFEDAATVMAPLKFST